MESSFIKSNQTSSTLEELIYQNEELTSRLRILIKKNVDFENEITELRKQLREKTDEILILQEQLAIYREKEKQTFDKVSQIKNYENRILQLEEKSHIQQRIIDRFQRYQERIKNQVKPYIHQLREYAKGLKEKNERLEQELESQHHHLQKMSEELKSLNDFYSHKLDHYQNVFKRERQDLFDFINSLKLEIRSLQKKAELTELAQFRQNELENELIRVQTEAKEKLDLLKEENIKLRSEIQKLQKAIKFSNSQKEPLEDPHKS
ncbi:MAG: hypothetical protein NZ480_03815 [Bdellovibrionaceae bacterium]|nr:hypothetical protein [Pseudobdellovibrionaceae bacterium]MDW8190038.1 hypothetical protein [Pseudobdellovibrionaceae bacterium]